MVRRELTASPIRTCVGCRSRAGISGLLRLVSVDGSLHVTAASSGRGAWLCRGSRECFDTAVRRKAFGRALRAPVSDQAIEMLRTELFRGD